MCRNSAHYFPSLSDTHQLLVAKFEHQLSALIASALMIYLCTHQANVCECERNDCHLLEHAHKCSKPSTNWRRTGNKEEGKKKKSKYQCGSNGKWENKGRGEENNSTCLRAFCSVALALIELSVRPTFSLKFKLIQFC